MDTAVTSFIVAIIVIGIVYLYLSQTASIPTSSVTIQSSITDGKTSFQSNTALPRSLNQKEGVTFSYTCWVRIDDFAYKYGTPKVVFTKGSTDLSTMCPAVFIDGTSNSLIVKLDTYGGTEVIPISNIPAKKWLHFALAIDQDSVDIYVNGILHTHHSISHLPKQNNESVHIGVNGGFEGKIADLQYYSYFINPQQVKSSMANPPKSDPSDVNAPVPPYFDITWWTGR